MSIYDLMPLRVLEQIERFETAAIEKQRVGQTLLNEAQDLLMEIDSIVGSIGMRAEREGWGVLRAAAERQDLAAWDNDPLPGQGARV